jgi:hypothetical protein
VLVRPEIAADFTCNRYGTQLEYPGNGRPASLLAVAKEGHFVMPLAVQAITTFERYNGVHFDTRGK